MDIVYDIETFPNVFLFTAELIDAPFRWVYEISDWKNDTRSLIEFLLILRTSGARMVGFNNIGFDYPVVHHLVRSGTTTAQILYAKAQAIFDSQDGERWMHLVKPSDCVMPQLDLFKIHHFDNKAKATSLKVLEFNMRSDSVEDLPFAPGTVLTQEQAEVLRKYNAHDVSQTKAFYFKTLDMIRFREELSKKYQRDFLNHNDTKIGKDFFVMELEKSGVQVYDFGPAGRTPRQTKRQQIHLRDAILPWIAFEHPELNRISNWLKEQTITETKGVFKDLTARVDGFEFVFGLGGIHGSVESQIVESDADHVVLDLDVTSYYPSIAIVNNFYPEHLGPRFCEIYANLFEQRKQYSKKSAESAMLKLALNGVYGDSNNQFSVFYDPLYTMRVTLNGQLLLCLLAERLMSIPGLQLIQANTDGLTVRFARMWQGLVDGVTREWQSLTKMNLEQAVYRRMFIRDVNNYIAQYENGDVKRKGAYEWKLGWHQNHSALVIPKVAEKVLVENAPIRLTVENWPDLHDFMLRTKVPRSSHLTAEQNDSVQNLPNTIRYCIVKNGVKLIKSMPPLKGKTERRRISVESGWQVQVCNNIEHAKDAKINFDYYCQEIEKLCLSLK